MKRLVATATTVLLVLLTLTLVSPPADAGTFHGRLRDAARSLKVAPEHQVGYARSKFNLWIDANGDGCDTRQEVLIAESIVAPVTGSSCTILVGEWRSYYDGVVTTDPSTFDIDHMVPLAEAWYSGAWRWNADTRTRYANDLGNSRSLVAVSASSNRSKGDKDPAEWMPPKKRVGCHYIRDWITVKIRWHLKADTTEKAFLVQKADSCRNVRMTVKRATVVRKSSTSGTTNTGFAITRVQYDPNGPGVADGTDYNGEYVVIQNTTAGTLSLAAWTLEDAVGNAYPFPGQDVGAGLTVTVHSGAGTDTATDLYADWGWTWNNTGDTANLMAPNGTVADTCTYAGGGSFVVC